MLTKMFIWPSRIYSAMTVIERAALASTGCIISVDSVDHITPE